MSKLIVPKNYKSHLDLKQTEQAIKLVKDAFEQNLSGELRLRRVTAPLFVLKGMGINDDLNGSENKVSFKIKDMENQEAEVVNSLAKWKRLALADYNIAEGYGIYTDMNAIRPDEELDNLHSLYVDQWDWEQAISTDSRNIEYLKKSVEKIYEVLKRIEFLVFAYYPEITPILPDLITFIHSEELLKLYPNLTPQDRETEFVKKHKAVFVIGIGGELANGKKHDGRAPDYDDWSTSTLNGYKGLNGDILLWHPLLEMSFEISSMGIRVDKNALLKQLHMAGAENRKDLYFHKRLLNDELPLSMGGGIGQSRLCMFFLRKVHVGEIQSAIWPADMVKTCKENGILLV